MKRGVKVIPTRWRGYTFRSRLEARWAVFFERLGAHWSYEHEGFELDGMFYLPDFRLKLADGANKIRTVWGEVKPEKFTEVEREKARRLSVHTGEPVILLIDVPDYQKYEMFFAVMQDHGKLMAESNECLLPCGSTRGRIWYWPSTDEVADLRSDPKYADAVNAARSARFEHGESPA